MNPFKKLVPIEESVYFEAKLMKKGTEEYDAHQKEIAKFTELGYKKERAKELLMKFKSFEKFQARVDKIELDGVDTPKEIYDFLIGRMDKNEIKQRSETYKKKFQKM